MTHPIEFRRHVLSIKKKEGLTFEQTAERFAVGIASLTRWNKSISPKTTRENRPRKVNLKELAKDVETYPDAYQYERALRFGVHPKSIWSGLRKLKITYKKTLEHPRADAEKRRVFQEKIEEHTKDGRPIVYIDESGFAHDMPRTHGYAVKGNRCFDTHDWQARGRINVIGALLETVLLTVGLFTGNINSDVFHGWIVDNLIPKLPPASVLVMDNATFHKRSDTKKSIKQAGHFLEYLPSYSPDYNPIEKKWAQAKATRRREQCTTEELFDGEFI